MASMESLFFALLVMAIAGLSNWLQKRAQQSQEAPPPVPGPPRQPSMSPNRNRPRVPPLDPAPTTAPTLETVLERELRRLLGGESPASAPPRPIPAPSQHQEVPPPISSVPRPRLSPTSKPMAPPSSSPAAPVLTEATPRFGAASSAYDRALHLHESVAQHFRGVDQRTSHQITRPASRKPAAPTPRRAFGRRQAREAFVASLIFNPPKSLEG